MRALGSGRPETAVCRIVDNPLILKYKLLILNLINFSSLRLRTIFVARWQETHKCSHRLAQFGKIEVITPTGHSSKFGRVVARKRLFITLKHFRDVDYIADVNIGQHLGQILQSSVLRLGFNILLIDAKFELKNKLIKNKIKNDSIRMLLTR